MVDRHDEMKELWNYLGEVMDGRGKLVLIEGEAGVGKTLLAKAFENKCLERGFTVMKGRCIYYENTDPYIPFIEALGEYLGGTDDEIEQERSGSISHMPMSLMGASIYDEEEEFAEISISDRRELMFDRVTKAVIKLSKKAPVMLFIDDMQWIDDASAQLLHHLARHTSEDRVLLLGAYRPEDIKGGHDLYPLEKILNRMADEKLINRIRLNRFTFMTASKLIKKKLNSEDLPQPFLMMMYKATEGNPYFITEILDSMVDEGVIDPYSYRWDPEKDLSDIFIPSSIKDVTMRRIDSLSKSEKKVLMYASVLGTEFNFELLEEAIDMDVIELLDIVDDLQSHGLIIEKEGEEDHEIYRFGHIQTRTSIYDNMGRSRKRVLHKQIGDAMEEFYQDNIEEHYYTLARHYFEGKEYGKAYLYSMAAGDRSMKSLATESAIEHYGRALECLTSASDIEDVSAKEENILKIIGDLSYDTSDWDRAINTLKRLIDMADERGDLKLEECATRRLGHIYREGQDHKKAQECFEDALKLAEELGENEGIADANRGLGYIHWREGKFKEAIEHYELAIDKAKTIENKRILALIYIEMGNVYSTIGEKDIAIQYYKRCIPTLNRYKSYRELARAYNNIGDGYMKMAEYDKAIDCFKKCAENANKIRNKAYLGWSYFNRAEAQAYKGETDEALNYARQAEKIMKNINDQLGLSGAYKAMGIAHYFQEKLNDALFDLKKGEAILERLDTPFEIAETKFWMGKVYHEIGNHGESKRYFREAKTITETIGATRFHETIMDEMEKLFPAKTE